MIELKQGNALLAECEAFLTELSAEEESALSGGYGYYGGYGDDDDGYYGGYGDDDDGYYGKGYRYGKRGRGRKKGRGYGGYRKGGGYGYGD